MAHSSEQKHQVETDSIRPDGVFSSWLLAGGAEAPVLRPSVLHRCHGRLRLRRLLPRL